MFSGPKSAPRNVNARPLSSSQMLVNWEEPESPNGQITVSIFFISLLYVASFKEISEL